MRHIGNCSKFCKMCRILLQNRKWDSSISRRTNQRLNTKRKREKRMKLWKRILSCFLALLLTVYLLPVQVMAEELGDLWPLTTENIAETPPDVIGEVLERRGENQKEFLLANGVRQVVIYPAAVHYQKMASGRISIIAFCLRLHGTARRFIRMSPVCGMSRYPPN